LRVPGIQGEGVVRCDFKTQPVDQTDSTSGSNRNSNQNPTEKPRTTMATLQNKVIASQRQAMLNGGMKEVFKHFFTFQQIPGITINSSTYQETSLRDILAFTIVHSALCDYGNIFGGFLCSIYSGTTYNDVDILFEERKNANHFCEKINNILDNILGLEYHHYDIVHTTKAYADKFSISVTLDGVSCTLDVDVVCKQGLNASPSGAIFHPVSWGRTLCYGKPAGLFFRFSNKKLGSKIPTVEYVVNLLKSQKDLRNTSFNYKPRPGHWEVVYENYIDSKFKNIEEDGYELV
jgi:hypothetical protein